MFLTDLEPGHDAFATVSQTKTTTSEKNDINNTEKKVMQYERDAITLRVRGLIFWKDDKILVNSCSTEIFVLTATRP